VPTGISLAVVLGLVFLVDALGWSRQALGWMGLAVIGLSTLLHLHMLEAEEELESNRKRVRKPRR